MKGDFEDSRLMPGVIRRERSMSAKKLEDIKGFDTLKAYFHKGMKGSYWKIWCPYYEASLPGQFNTKKDLEAYCEKRYVGEYV